MNITILKHLRNASLALAFLAIGPMAQAEEEAYLGVNGFLVSLPDFVPTVTFTTTQSNRTMPATMRGFKIRSVEPGSPAFQAGLRCGDILIEADHILLNSYGSLRDMRVALGRGELMRLVFLRGGMTRIAELGGVGTITSQRLR